MMTEGRPMQHVKALAVALDAAIDRLEEAATAYITESDRLNRERPITRPGEEPHHVYSRGRDHLLAAISSRHALANALGLMPRNPAVTVAQNHSD
jgi:hypothetical protein